MGSPLIIAVTIGGVGILNVVLFWFMPRLTRRDLYFAVTVAPGFREDPEGKSILRRYRTELMLVSAPAATAVVAGVSWLGVGFVPGGFFLQLAAAFVAFYRARQRVLPHAVPPTTIREAALHDAGPIVAGGRLVSSGPFLLLGACAAYLRIRRDELPARFTPHFPMGAQPHGWAGRAYPEVYFLSTAGILAALALTRHGMGHWARFVHADDPEHASELKFRRAVSIVILVAEYFITLQSSWIVLATRRHDFMAGPRGGIVVVLLPVALVLVLVAILVLAHLGQGGSRVSAGNAIASSEPVGDRTPDSCWKLGVLYFNRQDAAVLIERRFGLGYTLNFARPAAWIIVLLVLMGALVPLLAWRLRR